MFLIFKRTVSLVGPFECPQHIFCVRNKKIVNLRVFQIFVGFTDINPMSNNVKKSVIRFKTSVELN